MANDKDVLVRACRILEDEIEKNKKELDREKEFIQKEDVGEAFHRLHIGKKAASIASESLKHHLSLIQGSVKALEDNYNRNFFI